MKGSTEPSGRRHDTKKALWLGAVTLASAAGLGALAVPAGAATNPATPSTGRSLSAIQARAAAAITSRVDHLNAAISKVNADSKLGSAGPLLSAYLSKDIPGLQQLGQKIAADTTAAAARTDAKTITTNYRVFALGIPAARLAGSSDQITTATVPKLTAAAKAAGYQTSGNQATLTPLLADLSAQIGTASTSTSGVATTVLGYTPAQWNANHALLASSRTSVTTARTAVKKAESDLKQIRTDIKG
jgi:hypothetical protein